MKTYNLNIEGEQFTVTVDSVSGNTASVSVNGRSFNVNIEANQAKAVSTSITKPKPIATDSKPVEIPTVKSPVNHGGATSDGYAVKSPLPGVILDIKVNVNDTIKEGQVLAILEAMKMENEIEAERGGVIRSINVTKGESVLEGATIVTIE